MHRFVVDGYKKRLNWDKIKRWIFCAGKESRTFPSLLEEAAKVARNEDLRNVLLMNLNDELGDGDSLEAHFKHYLQLLDKLGIDRDNLIRINRRQAFNVHLIQRGKYERRKMRH
jgi:hypothetical protein